MGISTIRHDEIFPAKFRRRPITIIGAGAIGSRIFAALVELGMEKVTIVDFDNVEPHNLANQIFLHRDIGDPKVAGCWEFYKDKTGHEPDENYHFIEGRVPEDFNQLKGIVFLVVDSMEQRRAIFDTAILDNTDVTAVIEVRMAASHGNILTFNPHDGDEIDGWINTLIDDDKAEASACGSSLTVGTTASILANTAVWQMMNLLQAPAAVEPKINAFLVPVTYATEQLK